MSRQNPKRPSSSRTPTSRPRKLAGQGGPPAPVESGVPPVESGAPPVESGDPSVETSASTVETPDSTVETPDSTVETPDSTLETPDSTDETPDSTISGLFDSRRATVILVVLVLVLGLGAAGLFVWDAVSDDEPATASKQPVVISGDDATDAVAAAAKSAETIVATSYQDYDKQVDEATGLMTAAFAKEYRQTAKDIEPDFVAAKTEIQARVVAQGIVHSTRTEVQALLFLNQYVSKDGGDTTYTPYRALVTVVHTDRGWLVSGLDTK